MSHRVRFSFPNGTTGVWALTYPTREAAQNAVREREADTGLAYTVEEVPEPGSVAAHHVEILRKRVEELNVELATVMANLATAPSVPVGASEAPGEGGDCDRSRLEALERWLKGNTQRLVYFSKRQLLVAVSDSVMDETVAPTLAALADKLAEKETNP